MATDPLFYEFIGAPSVDEERSRAIITSPNSDPYRAPSGDAYYNSFLSRRRGQPTSNFARRAYNVRDWQRSEAQADYEREAQGALQALSGLDPGDPDMMTKGEQTLMRSRYGQTLVRDPRVTSVLKSRLAESSALQKQFDSDPDSRVDYIMGRQEGLDHTNAFARAMSGTENRKNRLWFAEKGGKLADFDRFSPNGRFDRAAAQEYLNTVPSKKDAAKPWQERLSFKEGEAIREMARGARELQDFEDEFAQHGGKLTRDEYVKQFKNAPNFEAYRSRRLSDVGDQAMREYGLSREEAANLLGLQTAAPTGATTAAQADPWADRTTSGPLAIPAVAPVPVRTAQGTDPFADRTTSGTGAAIVPAGTPAASAPVSQADFKRIDAPAAPAVEAAPVSFESLSQQVAQRGAEQRKAREFSFPTLGDDLEPTPTRTALNAVQTAAQNMISRAKFSPTEALASVVQPGGIASLAMRPAPTVQQQSDDWTKAKDRVRKFVDSLPEEQRVKALGSFLVEQSIPSDFFTKQKGDSNRRVFLAAGDALRDALKEEGEQDFALRDAGGVHGWDQVAKIVAQEELGRRGLVKTPGVTETVERVLVTSPEQWASLPKGTPIRDAQGNLGVKK